MNTAFSHALRVVVCTSCGEAVHGSPAGGEVTCPLCEAAAGLSQLGEEERVERLRQQHRRPVELPADLEHLVDGGRLVGERLADALAVWQQRRRELAAGEGSAESPFYALTLLLHDHMRGQDDDLQLRAVLESALETLPSPPYRQVLRCALALEAARVGDVAGAEDWLAPCERRPYDLVADSAYRHAAAYVATLEGQWARALEVLGASGQDVPVAADRDVACTLLRANAHERLGRVDDAVEELSAGMLRSPDGAAAFGRARKEEGGVQLCRRSFQSARSRIERARSIAPGEREPPRRQRRMSRTLRVALPWLGGALACLVAALAIGPSVTLGGGQRLDMLFFALALSLSLPAVALLLKRARRSSR
jgi:hypothetical protein